MTKLPNSAYVILDRDGTLIKFEHYLIEPEKVVLAEGTVQGMQLLKEIGFVFGMITNQSVIGRGLATDKIVTKVNERVISLLSEQDIEFQFVLYCPHTPEDLCKCRKPEPGLGNIAIQDHGLDPKWSYMIGDQSSDVGFGHRIGCKTVQIIGETSDVSDANYLANNILEAAQWIKSDIERGSLDCIRNSSEENL